MGSDRIGRPVTATSRLVADGRRSLGRGGSGPRPREEIGALLVEAKGRVGELRSGGAKATAQSSIDTIRSAFADVQASLGVAPNCPG